MYEIPIKTQNEIEIMREGGAILGKMLSDLKDMAKPGVDMWELETAFVKMCEENKVRPACKGYAPLSYPPFPAGLCISIDDESVHNYPVKGRLLKEGDLVTIDTVIEHKGYYLDHAISFGIGTLPHNKQKVMDTAQHALIETLSKIKPGVKVGVLSNTMQKTAAENDCTVLVDYAGHGIGKSMHEPPEIPCYGLPQEGPELKEGMVLAVEPLICENSNVLEHNNYWQTKTVDQGIFAQFEHTVLVTEDGYEILTKG